ncbi:hypothetical protein DTL42_08880 [Bremerella cremea]|uniref:Uncharacterized protein n=1 Tax=Bremerella cremea TaxID=1031537 RepID=A0A368KTQ3_9BACT|nr:hypothetical protein [Bremerella cremea]RCS52923.1 hypothetical protein DTL42_08880 [Bremerella cremea]
MAPPNSDPILRFGLKDLLLVTGIFGYFCGLVSLGVSTSGSVLLSLLVGWFGQLGILAIFVWPFVLFGSLAWSIEVLFFGDDWTRPKAFLLTNVVVVLFANILPLGFRMWAIGDVTLSLAATLSVGSLPLTLAWLVHRASRDMPVLVPQVLRWLNGLLLLELLSTAAIAGLRSIGT